jgi:S-DNA-T family DNA segregation ATPase FtsK/SpoIIIE
LNALIGLLDDPANQRQTPLMLSLAEQDGQLIMVGAPGSGKEMLARTLLVSLARTHTPDELHFYLLEFGGQALRALEDLPHVGGIFTPLDDERVRRLFRLLLDSLERRKRLCNDAGVDGIMRLRELQPAQAPAAVVVVVTGFAEFRTLFQEELLQLTRLIREGGPYGIHVVLVGDRAGDVPMAISSVIARRVVLRLASADDYAMVLGTRLRLSKDQQFPVGRGWYGRPPLEFQTATPGYEKDENKQIVELRHLAEEMDDIWDGERPQPIEKLSSHIPLSKVFERAQMPQPPFPTAQTMVPIGLDAIRLHPVLVDLVDDGPDFIIASTPKGGKTTLLRTWALALAKYNSPQQIQFILVSIQRDSLQPLRSLPHVLDYCRDTETFCEDGSLARIQHEIEYREQLVQKSRQHLDRLPHIVVMIDDYDALSNEVSSTAEVNEHLATLAKEGRDVNIHTIVTGPLPKMGVGYSDKVISQLKVNRSGFLLRVLDATEQNPLGVRLRAAEIKKMPAGRGYLARGGTKELLQVATPGDDEAVGRWVARITETWQAKEIAEANWPQHRPAQQETDGSE